MRGIDLAAYDTLHRSRKNVDQISTDTGINKSSLYRYGLPRESNGLDIPLRKLVPIMKSAGNYVILKTLAAACGFLLVRVPRAARSKLDDDKLVNTYQRHCNDAVHKLLQFFEKPTVKSHKALNDALDTVVTDTIGIKKGAAHYHQVEIEFDVH